MSITVRTTPKNRITINTQQGKDIKTVSSAALRSSAPVYLRGLADVDGTSLDNNETVVYDEATDKFVVKTLPIVNGGEF